MQILYFASVREAMGRDGESLKPPAEIATLAQFYDWLAGRSPAHAAALADRARLRAAVDQELAGPETDVRGATEIAIFPPVTGG